MITSHKQIRIGVFKIITTESPPSERDRTIASPTPSVYVSKLKKKKKKKKKDESTIGNLD